MNSTQQRRIGAFIIDVIIIGFFVTFSENLLSSAFQAKSFELMGIQFHMRIGTSFLFYMCYFMIFELLNNGSTLGKLLFGIKVVHEDETEISKRTGIKRSLLKVVSIMILPLAILLFLFSDYFTIQDHYSRTITVRKS
jgi:uncharacterized RDD family membrane protein YckC